ncbi:lytic transglycosylase domain-containing protein [Tritonibacter multivorans]|uniref:lytic transglycosylase domain-containing protein n=1 Tax=Tritonibacter multivorans TaxID=928856 RepID=UPI001F33FB8A|nr:lytic transglycosylase domain-containing protein [Tritonibacter multivorans]MDA7419468.1 lytic transglycosylase domain-containing protein [Tritonibacter multivorans]
MSRRTESDDPPAEETDSTAATPVPQEARFAWFWEEVSPALEAASAGRLETALEVIAAHPEVTAPRLQQMQDIVNAYGIDILTGTLGTQVSPAWVLAVIAVESSGRADAVSSAGAQGLMQLMPETAVEHGVTDPFTPKDNIAGGVRFIDQLMALYGGDPMLVAAAYNAGPGAVRDHDGVPPYTETRDYVPKVLAAYQMARSLCRTPPIMISDGCIFHSMN